MAPQEAGAGIKFLPSYSPGFDRIETAFSELNALLRKAAARTVDQVWAVIGSNLDAFTPAECAHYFVAAGYDADGIDSALAPSTSTLSARRFRMSRSKDLVRQPGTSVPHGSRQDHGANKSRQGCDRRLAPTWCLRREDVFDKAEIPIQPLCES